MRRLAIILLLLVGLCGASSSPSIVAHYSAVNQTASIPTTTVYAVPSTGTAMYVINLYVESGVCPVSGSTITTGWTDDLSTTNGQTTFSLPCGSVPFSQALVLSVRMVGSSNFTVSTNLVAGGPTYNVYIVLEKLP